MKELNSLILLGEKYLCIDNNSYVYHMCRMAWLAQRDGFNNDIITVCFLYRLGYLVEINSKSYCLNNKDYGKLAVDYLNKIYFNNNYILEIIGNYIDIKKYNYIKDNSSNYIVMIIENGGIGDLSILNFKKKINMGMIQMVQYYEDYNLNEQEQVEFNYKKYINYYTELCGYV